MQFRLEKLNKICFVGARVMDVETCFFAKRSQDGSLVLLGSHGLSFPNKVFLPAEIIFSQTEFLQYTDGPYEVQVTYPMVHRLKSNYFGGISKILPEIGEIDFIVMSRQHRGIVDRRECEAFIALGHVQNMIVAIDRTKLTNSSDPTRH